MDDNKLKGLDDKAAQPEVFNVARPGGRRAFLQNLSKGAAVAGVAGVSADCKPAPLTAQPTGPSPTTTTAATTSTTTSVTTTALEFFTLAGVVSDQRGGAVVGALVFVVDGPNANKSSVTDGNGYYSIPGILPGSFTLRVTLRGFFLRDMGLTVSGDRRLDIPVTTTSTTSTSTTTTTAPTTSVGTTSSVSNTPHYWYPN